MFKVSIIFPQPAKQYNERVRFRCSLRTLIPVPPSVYNTQRCAFLRARAHGYESLTRVCTDNFNVSNVSVQPSAVIDHTLFSTNSRRLNLARFTVTAGYAVRTDFITRNTVTIGDQTRCDAKYKFYSVKLTKLKSSTSKRDAFGRAQTRRTSRFYASQF